MDDALRLVLQHRRLLYAFIRSVVRNDADAEDVFQEVAVIIVKKAALVPQIENFRAWSTEIARRTALDHLKRSRGKRELPVPAEEMVRLLEAAALENAPPPAEATAELEAMRACFERIPERLRHMMRMRFVDDHSYEQIAGAAAATVAAVRRAVARARLALVACTQRRLQQRLGQA